MCYNERFLRRGARNEAFNYVAKVG